MKNLTSNQSYFNQLATNIKQLGKDFGFVTVGITDGNISENRDLLTKWLEQNYYGSMQYLTTHHEMRSDPQKLFPARRIIICGIKYSAPLHPEHPIAAFALGQDYSKKIKKLLKEFAKKIVTITNYQGKTRVFAGNVPVLEKALALHAGVGWQGKNSLIIHPENGSYCCLGGIFIDLELPIDSPLKDYCGSCRACLDICPTKALVAPKVLDASRCISYFTIEHRGTIPETVRPLIGTRIFGCDLCQQVCPWNQNLSANAINHFPPFAHFATANLIELFTYSEATFREKTSGSPIRRIGYECFLRNIAIALGNSPKTPEIIQALKTREDDKSELVREHVRWALEMLDGVKS